MEFKQQLAARIAVAANLSEEQVFGMLETPPKQELGDFAFPCFSLAKVYRKAPAAIANDLAKELKLPEGIGRVGITGGYLNFFLDRAAYTKAVIGEVLEQGEGYGSAREGEGKTVVIDYSSINIAKPFHIGHLLSTAIGGSLYKIYRFLGYHVVGVNHLGDWGTQFGKLIAAYKRWGCREEVEARSIHAMLELYVRFHEEAETNKALDDEGRAWFKKIEDGDPEALEIFEWFKALTLKEVQGVYELLGIRFDSYAGESFYNDKMQPVIDELRAKNLLEFSEGAYVVPLPEKELPPCIILKSDGATLYATRDLAAAFYRKKTYDFDKSLYVVAYQQNLHFAQLFAVIEKMGYSWASQMEHINFGMVSLADGTLSTRKGRVIFLEEVLNTAIEKTRAVMEEKSPGLENADSIAKMVGVGAVVFFALSNARIKDIVYDADRVLNFDGETGPYVQYTHARCKSLEKKAPEAALTAAPDYSALASEEAYAVIKLLGDFPTTVRRAAEKNEPYLITRYSVALAQAFNRFYFEHRVIDEELEKTAARLALAQATAQAIKNALALIGVGAPDKM